MENEAAAAAETPAKSPDTNSTPNFQERFAAQLEKWRDEGCPRAIEAEGNDAHALCGAPPNAVKMDKANSEGNIVMHVACKDGHENVWSFSVPQIEMKAELARQAEAAKAAEAAGRKALDPMKASVKITMDLATQEVTIEPWVPTPGVGLQLAAILTAHFQDLFVQARKNNAPSKLKLPPNGIIHPKTGKILTQ